MICRSIKEIGLQSPDRVFIVGGGTVGIYLAVQLAKAGREVLMVEAGNEQLDNFAEDSFESVGRPHATIKIGRSRSLGGTSNLWGGQLVEYQAVDFEGRDWLPDSKWPINANEVAGYYRETYENLGMPTKFLEDAKVFGHLKTRVPALSGGLEFFLTRWMRLPSLAATYREQLEANPNIRVLLDHTVTGIGGDDGKVRSVEVIDPGGHRHILQGGCLVLAAGTFENVRLLCHASASPDSNCPWRGNDNIGRFFQDHLSGRVGSVQTLDRRRFLNLFTTIVIGGFRFLPKLRLTDEALRRERLLNIHAMMVCESSIGENMVFLRQFMKSVIYGRKISNLSELLRNTAACGRHLPPLMWRYIVANRVFVPSGSKISMQIQAEQCPLRESRISVDPSRPDKFGLPKVVLDWRIGGEELGSIRDFSIRVRDAMREANLAEVKLLPGVEEGDASLLERMRDHNHHAGGTCMGWSARDGVVDRDLRVFGTENLYILGASVFRTTSNANTTFLALALATRLARTLSRQSLA